ncbi:hypothetical protein, partial [Streptomyces sp. NPDC041003]|uniref:hypothetical protein n=1 Tax=Streptomyces sp. NPDC041003 TaxID=3155730 RepID=UPI0034102F06
MVEAAAVDGVQTHGLDGRRFPPLDQSITVGAGQQGLGLLDGREQLVVDAVQNRADLGSEVGATGRLVCGVFLPLCVERALDVLVRGDLVLEDPLDGGLVDPEFHGWEAALPRTVFSRDGSSMGRLVPHFAAATVSAVITRSAASRTIVPSARSADGLLDRAGPVPVWEEPQATRAAAPAPVRPARRPAFGWCSRQPLSALVGHGAVPDKSVAVTPLHDRAESRLTRGPVRRAPCGG